jgi:hypothetical protein
VNDPTLLSWIERGQNIAALLVAIGVAGEFALGFMASPARRRIEAARESEMVRLTNESAKASERAANAEKQAGSFQLQIAQANNGAADALERAAKAEENLGNAKKSAAEANERAVKAELELARIKLPRRLNSEQQQRIGAALSQFAGQKFAFLVFGDPESLQLLADIDGALRIAKWERVSSPPGLGGDIGYKTAGGTVQSMNEIGLKAWVAADEAASESALLAFANALTSEGLSCESHLANNLAGRSLRMVIITIGQKQL